MSQDTLINIFTKYTSLYINLVGLILILGFDYILEKIDKQIIKDGI